MLLDGPGSFSQAGGQYSDSRTRAHSRPRIHDLRHTFTCRRVQSWYDAGEDVDQAMPTLSAYLGHAKVSDTYWYLTATPELLDRAAARFEPFAGAKHKEDHP